MDGKRVAILFDEDGKEIYRGNPADMPVRFITANGAAVDWSMSQAAYAGIPIDEDFGDDLELHPLG